VFVAWALRKTASNPLEHVRSAEAQGAFPLRRAQRQSWRIQFGEKRPAKAKVNYCETFKVSHSFAGHYKCVTTQKMIDFQSAFCARKSESPGRQASFVNATMAQQQQPAILNSKASPQPQRSRELLP
jgi:hypothetical protein